jgi:hypothetical protein
MSEFINSTEYGVYKACMSLTNKYWNSKLDSQTLESLENDSDKIIQRYKENDRFRFCRAQVNMTQTNIKRHIEYNSRFDGMGTDLI